MKGNIPVSIFLIRIRWGKGQQLVPLFAAHHVLVFLLHSQERHCQRYQMVLLQKVPVLWC